MFLSLKGEARNTALELEEDAIRSGWPLLLETSGMQFDSWKNSRKNEKLLDNSWKKKKLDVCSSKMFFFYK